jgi:hypothetical protein
MEKQTNDDFPKVALAVIGCAIVGVALAIIASHYLNKLFYWLANK